MEVWKDIIGYEGQYQISNYGRVRALLNNHREIRKRPLIRKARINRDGYLYLNLTKNSVARTYKIHRLVATHFIENPENKTDVNHKDGIKTNNHFLNLEWNTKKENFNHSILIGLQNPIGEKNWNSKLSNEDINNIRNSCLTRKQLSKLYNVSITSINNIITYKSWKHLV